MPRSVTWTDGRPRRAAAREHPLGHDVLERAGAGERHRPAVGRELDVVDVHGEGVARHRSLDEDGTGDRVDRGLQLRQVVVPVELGVDGVGRLEADRLAGTGRDAEHGLAGRVEPGDAEGVRQVVVGGHAGSPSEPTSVDRPVER